MIDTIEIEPMPSISAQEDGKVLIKLAKEFFSREAVFAGTDKHTSMCSISVMPLGETHVGITLSKPLDGRDLQTVAQMISDEILDQQVRLDLESRNGHIRTLIVRHAFSPIRNIEKELED